MFCLCYQLCWYSSLSDGPEGQCLSRVRGDHTGCDVAGVSTIVLCVCKVQGKYMRRSKKLSIDLHNHAGDGDIRPRFPYIDAEDGENHDQCNCILPRQVNSGVCSSAPRATEPHPAPAALNRKGSPGESQTLGKHQTLRASLSTFDFIPNRNIQYPH